MPPEKAPMLPEAEHPRRFRPELLTLARHSCGLTQSDFARGAEVSQALVSRIEDGTRTPSEEVVARFADALGYPTEFFYLNDPIYGAGIGELYHRKRQSISAKALAKLHAQINIRRFHVARLLRAVDWIEVDLPVVEQDLPQLAPEEAARRLRARWHLPMGPVQSVSRVVESAGIIIIPFDFETPLVDAVGQWVPSLPPLIFVNVAIPQDRLRWTVMHEVGHLVLHHGLTLSEIGPDIEDQANRFSSEFLMPGKEIRPQLLDLSLPKLAQLKRQWRVAMSALLKRASDLNTITKRRAEVLWTEIGKAGYRTREPRELDVHGETPGALLGEMLRLYREDLKYSTEELAALFAVRPESVRSMYQLQEGPQLRLLSKAGQQFANE